MSETDRNRKEEKERAGRESELKNLKVFYIGYPVVLKKKKIDASVWILTQF